MIEWILAPVITLLLTIVTYFLRNLHHEFYEWKRELIKLKTGLRACEVELRALQRLLQPSIAN